MAWLFDTTNFVSRLHCGEWEPWMVRTIIIGHLCYICAYVLTPLALILFAMYRGKGFFFPRWLIGYVSLFMVISCMIRLDVIMSFSFPAYRFFTIVEGIGGIVALGSIFVIPYSVKLATDIPSKHKIRNLENENLLYRKLDELHTVQTRITTGVLLDKISKNLDKQTLQEIELMMDSLVQR